MNKFYILIFCFLLLLSQSSFAQSYSYDKKAGAEAALQVEQTIGIYNDSTLTSYINQVGQRLVEALGKGPFEFQFFVVDMEEPNAFALPGGYIYISRGLLSLVNNEAELAGVIGHEMIHVTKRHAVKQMKKGILPGLLQIPGAVVGIINPNLGRIINTPFSLGSELFMSNYSRKQETEADGLGIRLAADAGYDPEKLAVILKNLAADVELTTGESEKRSYFDSHPITPKRVEKIEKDIPGLEWTEKPSIAPDEMSLYSKLQGMAVGPNPAQGIFDGNVFRHPDLNLAIDFPDKWNTVNVPVAVVAAQPEGEAQLFVRVENTTSKPDSIGQSFVAQLKNDFNVDPDESMAIDINGFPAWMVTLTDVSGQQPLKVQLYWVKAGEVMLQVVGVSFPKHEETVAHSAQSIRPLSEEERKNITGLYLSSAIASENENLLEFSTRNKNNWDENTTLLKNGMDKNTTLKEAQLLKIAVEEPYISPY